MPALERSASGSPPRPRPGRGRTEDSSLLSIPGDAKQGADADADAAAADDDGGGALEAGGEVNVWDWRRIGYLANYFMTGFFLHGVPGTIYGVFAAYLNTPAYVYGAAKTLAKFPWSIKLLLAVFSDAFPIRGYRRRPWMVIGWVITTVGLIALALVPLPDPYFCIKPDGFYDTKIPPCNKDAAHSGLGIAILMMLVAIGYMQADVAADALTVSYARREPKARRGRTQTLAYLVREVGSITAKLLIGFGMNGKRYNGSFDASLSFSQIMAIFSVLGAVMVPLSWFLVEEPRVTPAAADGELDAAPEGKAEGGGVGGKELAAAGADAGKGVGDGSSSSSSSSSSSTGELPVEQATSFRAYCAKAIHLMSSGALFEVLMYQILANIVSEISTTAGVEVTRVWANVQNLQNQVFGIVSSLIYLGGLALVRARFLNSSWRGIIIVTTIFTNVVDMPFTFMTIYDLVRNQYFFLDEALITAIPSAVAFMVNSYVYIELTEPGTEAFTYGLLTTAHNLGSSVASGISNMLFGAFRPSLSDSQNYFDDTPSFRNTVAWSYGLTYAFSFASLLFLPLLPNQKDMASARKKERQHAQSYAYGALAILGVLFVYALAVDLLALIPSTSCLILAGGDGCGAAPAMPPELVDVNNTASTNLREPAQLHAAAHDPTHGQKTLF